MSEAEIESAPEAGEAEAEQMLADAVAEPNDEPAGEEKEEPPKPAMGPNGFPLNTPVAQMSVEEREAYWKFNSRKWEKDAKINADAAKKYAEYEDSQKTELQRLIDRAEAAERERDEERRSRARLTAAAAHNLSADLLDRLGGGTEEEINEAAQVLSQGIDAEVTRRLPDLVEAEVARRLADLPQTETAPPARQRPVESLTPGAMPANSQPEDGNDFLRRMAGRT